MVFESKFAKYKRALSNAIDFLSDDNIRNEYQNMANIMEHANKNALNPSVLKQAGMWYAIIDFYKRDADETRNYLKQVNKDDTSKIDELIMRIEVDETVAKEMSEVIPLYDKLRFMFSSINSLRKKINPKDLLTIKDLEEKYVSLITSNVDALKPTKDFL